MECLIEQAFNAQGPRAPQRRTAPGRRGGGAARAARRGHDRQSRRSGLGRHHSGGDRPPCQRLARAWSHTTSRTRTDCSRRRSARWRARWRCACGSAWRRRTPRAAACRRSSTSTSRRRNSTSAPAPRGSPSGARCCTCEGLKRVQTAYQRRMLSNLRSDLRRMIPAEDARTLAFMIAAMIDGVWLRAALSEWREADSESARALLTAFVDGRLKDLAQARAAETAGARAPRVARPQAARLRVMNPANGTLLAEIAVDGAAQVDAAVARAQAAQRRWAALSGAARGRVLQRAAQLLRECNDELAELETRNTGKPDPGDARGGRAVRRRVPGVLRGARRRHRRRASRPRAGRVRLHAARAARRGGRHRCLELPAADRMLEIGAGARVRQRHAVQARRADPAHRHPARGAVPRRRPAGRACSRWCRARPRPGAS